MCESSLMFHLMLSAEVPLLQLDSVSDDAEHQSLEKKPIYPQCGVTMESGSLLCPLIIGQGLKYGKTGSLKFAS